MQIKIITINLPEYTIDKEPDYSELGKKVDLEITKNFPNGKYIIRAIGIQDHPNLTIDKLIEIIKENGTDKYDPTRKSVAHEEFANYNYDLQAGEFETKNSKIVADDLDEVPSLFGQTMYDFYNHAPYDRGFKVRIDLLIIYDANKLETASKINEELPGVNPKLEKYLFKFKNRQNKKDALVGFIKILN